MKKIIVVAKYEAYVEDDITVSMVQELAEEEIRNGLDSFRIFIDDYKGDGDNCPWFELDDVMSGTETMISVGGD